MAFFCIHCKSAIEPKFKACPFCGEPITEFLRRYLEQPIDGKYQILSRLGIGGMGEVYKVLHTHLNAVRVIKLMRPNIMSEEGSHERFVREARLATKIHHPNVATLYDFSSLEDGSYYMVWEYIDGTNLTELIRARGCLSPRYAAMLAAQALHGLDAIHRAGVVHRDISPENLMIMTDEEGDERVKIIDLGIAKQWGDAADDKTKTGMFVGKWKYCSPEHLGMMKEGERIDGRADIYSFGIVLYELLTGTPPFLADSPHRYLLLHATETPKPLSVTNPSVSAPPELEAAIFKSLEKDRNNRFASPREFARTLEALIPTLPDTAAAPVVKEHDEESTEERASPYKTRPATTERVSAADESTVRTIDIAETARESAPAATTERAEVYMAEPTVRQSVVVNKRAENKTLDRSGDPTMEVAKTQSPIVWAGGLAAAAIVIVVVVLMLQAPKDASEPIPAGNVVASTVPASTTSRLALNAFPWAEVIHVKNLANGKALQFPEQLVTPTSIDLPPGRYEVVLVNPRFEPITKVVEIAPYEDETLMIEFTSPSEAPLPKFEGNFR